MSPGPSVFRCYVNCRFSVECHFECHPSVSDGNELSCRPSPGYFSLVFETRPSIDLRPAGGWRRLCGVRMPACGRLPSSLPLGRHRRSNGVGPARCLEPWIELVRRARRCHRPRRCPSPEVVGISAERRRSVSSPPRRFLGWCPRRDDDVLRPGRDRDAILDDPDSDPVVACVLGGLAFLACAVALGNLSSLLAE